MKHESLASCVTITYLKMLFTTASNDGCVVCCGSLCIKLCQNGCPQVYVSYLFL